MIISEELEFVFLGIPRTSNRAMHLALLDLPGAYRNGSLHNMDVPAHCQDFFTFCAVRNPYRRTLAWFRWRQQPHPWGSDAAGMTFDDFIEASAAGTMGPNTVRQFTQGLRLDHVIRYEDLPSSFHSIKSIPGIDQLRTIKIGQRLTRHWKMFYDQRLADRVFELTRADFEEFAYDRDSWRSD